MTPSLVRKHDERIAFGTPTRSEAREDHTCVDREHVTQVRACLLDEGAAALGISDDEDEPFDTTIPEL